MSEVSMNLPPGINMTIENFNQESEITLSSVFTPSVGQKYSLSIDGFDYDYRVQVGDDVDDIGIGLSNIIPGSEMMTSFNTATNILSLVGSIPGKYYAIKPNLPSNNAVSFSSVRSNENLRMITLSGSPNSLALIGETTDYNYTIETSGGANYCSDNDSISGLIRIIYYDPCSELNPGSITSSQTICSGDIPNQLNINQASVGENSSNVIYEWFSSIDNETFNTKE